MKKEIYSTVIILMILSSISVLPAFAQDSETTQDQTQGTTEETETNGSSMDQVQVDQQGQVDVGNGQAVVDPNEGQVSTGNGQTVVDANEGQVSTESNQTVVDANEGQVSTGNGQAVIDSDENLEKIPSPDKIKNYRNIKKRGKSLWGININHGQVVISQGQINIGNGRVVINDGDLEKILAPWEIPFFTGVIKKGNSLWGKRKNQANVGNDEDFEKIPNPSEIKFFKKVKKVGNSLWGIKFGRVLSKTHKIVTAEEKECVITAIKNKDQAIIDATNALTTAMTTAINARTTCQLAALESTDKQRENLDNCTKAFVKASNEASKGNKEAKKTIWKNYTDSLSKCSQAKKPTTTEQEEDILVEDGGTE